MSYLSDLDCELQEFFNVCRESDYNTGEALLLAILREYLHHMLWYLLANTEAMLNKVDDQEFLCAECKSKERCNRKFTFQMNYQYCFI